MSISKINDQHQILVHQAAGSLFDYSSQKRRCSIPACHAGMVPDGTSARKSCPECEERKAAQLRMKADEKAAGENSSSDVA